MPETFRCPSCSAPLEFEGRPAQKCSFCGSSVIVPLGTIKSSEMFGGAGMLDFGDLSRLTGQALKTAEIQRLIQGGRKIEAIKVFRSTFGVGLKEAKDAVEAMERGESIDLSKIHIRSPRIDAQNLEMVKKAGLIAGGSIVTTFLVTALLIGAAVLGAIYFASRSIERAVGTSADTAPASGPVKAAEDSTSVAAEILKFGGEGTGAGKFKDNRTIAVDAGGRIYSADFGGGRIQVFDAGGRFQSQILADTGKAVNALAVDRKGNLFVLQGYNVHRIDLETGETQGKFRVDYAADLALGLDGRLYVPTRRGEIAVLSAEGAKLRSIPISKDLNIGDIRQLAVDGAGNFYVLDGRSYAVFKLSPEGKLLTRFGGQSRAPGENAPRGMFSGRPHDLAVDSQGRIYVSQTSRISVFDPNGNLLDDFKATQAFGLAVNEQDELLVASRPFVVKYRLTF